MSWEAIGVIVAILSLLGSIGVVVYAMGKQNQKIEDLGEKYKELKEEHKEFSTLPIKVASLDTGIQYLIKEVSELKSLLMNRSS